MNNEDAGYLMRVGDSVNKQALDSCNRPTDRRSELLIQQDRSLSPGWDYGNRHTSEGGREGSSSHHHLGANAYMGGGACMG